MKYQIPCTIFRGGTSKGLYLMEKHLPPPGKSRDDLLLRLMGSPDPKQIDGLGGGVSVTSKVAIIAPSEREGVDVDYTFAQVSVEKPIVSYVGNCGNISSGVGPFAIESGLVEAQDGETTVRVYNTNTKKVMIERVQTPGKQVSYEGDCAIAGVAGTAAPVKIYITQPGGSVFPNLLPTGNPRDILEIPGVGPVPVSIVDAANPLVFVSADAIGLTGAELPQEMDRDEELLAMLEDIRGMAAQTLGLVSDYRKASNITPGVPKMTVIAPPMDYATTTGRQISAEGINLTGRMMSMQKAHPTYAMTGAMCTAAAAVIPGTIVNELCTAQPDDTAIRIGHPEGVFEAGVKYRIMEDGRVEILETYAFRTARMLMKGTAFC